MSSAYAEKIVLGIQHINSLDSVPFRPSKQDYTIAVFGVYKLNNQELDHQCRICKTNIQIVIYSEDIVVKQFWKFVLGTIVSILTTVLLFNYFKNWTFVLAASGLCFSLRVVYPRAKIKEINYDFALGEDQTVDTKSEHKLTYKVIPI